jgi:hypothetical protein
MSSPTYATGTVVLNNVTLTHGQNAAALVDFSTDIQGMLWCQMVTGTAPTTGTTFTLRRCVKALASGLTTLSAGPSSGATSLSVNSAALITKGCSIAVLSASTKVGEVVIVTSVSGTTLTVPAIINGYSTGDLVFLIDVGSGGATTPGSSWANNASYDNTLEPPVGIYVIEALNGDGTQTVNVTAVTDLTTGVA